jgi:hypothetical protein
MSDLIYNAAKKKLFLNMLWSDCVEEIDRLAQMPLKVDHVVICFDYMQDTSSREKSLRNLSRLLQKQLLQEKCMQQIKNVQYSVHHHNPRLNDAESMKLLPKVDMFRCGLETQESADSLCFLLDSFKCIEFLRIIQGNYLFELQLDNLFTVISENITRLELGVTKVHAFQIGKLLKRSKRLKYLSVKLEFSDKREVEPFCDALAHCEILTTLSIGSIFFHYIDYHDDLGRLFYAIKLNKNIKNLKVEKSLPVTTRQNLYECLHNLSALRLSNANVNDLNLMSFLKQNVTLRKVKVFLGNCQKHEEEKIWSDALLDNGFVLKGYLETVATREPNILQTKRNLSNYNRALDGCKTLLLLSKKDLMNRSFFIMIIGRDLITSLARKLKETYSDYKSWVRLLIIRHQ